MLLCCMKGSLDGFRSVASLWGWTCQVVRGFPTFAPCLEHICAGGGECSKYGFGIVISVGILYLRLRIMLLVGMSWAYVLSVMLARGVRRDVRHPCQEEAL